MAETKTQTLPAFLLARIAEDEAVAKAAAHEGASWISAPNGYDSGAVEAVDGDPGDVGIVVYDEGCPSEHQATHIARHDPARVLAECEAKRRIVELRREVIENGNYPQQMRQWYLTCLAHMALPHADHPDYREEWKP